MKLKKVTKEHYAYLYELLKEKEEYQNISHKELPTYEEHVKFNDGNPYKEDYIIFDEETPMGRIYITDRNEIGIHIAKRFRGSGIGGRALDYVLETKEGPFLANIAPDNIPSQKFFQKHGFGLIQYTYKYE